MALIKDKILVIEDEKSISYLLGTVLTANGYDVIKAYTGTEACEMLDAYCPDLILLDVMLPKKNGFDVCRALRDQGSSVPVIILTAREELHYLRTHLNTLAANAWYRAPLMHWPSRCFTVQEPYGRVLIMSPWNYPFQLSLEPLIGALAAGNCVMIKPGSAAPATAAAMLNSVLTRARWYRSQSAKISCFWRR